MCVNHQTRLFRYLSKYGKNKTFQIAAQVKGAFGSIARDMNIVEKNARTIPHHVLKLLSFFNSSNTDNSTERMGKILSEAVQSLNESSDALEDSEIKLESALKSNQELEIVLVVLSDIEIGRRQLDIYK